ncbi:MAG: hypothetical protein PWQ57_544 [Desulfovibrionales bacterium]|nr:hypothetical protein [Desulfovibrionales bacterium]
MQYTSIPTDFIFWGRDYVHGTHVIDAFLRAFDQWGPERISEFRATFLKPIVSQACFVRYDRKDDFLAARGDLYAEFKVTAGDATIHVGLMPDSRPVVERIPNDEDVLTVEAVVDSANSRISVPFSSTDRFFSRIVASNKKMLWAILGKEGYTPWRLGRLSFQPDSLEGAHEAVIQMVSNIGNAMVRSRVLMEGRPCGEIQFVRKKL